MVRQQPRSFHALLVRFENPGDPAAFFVTTVVQVSMEIWSNPVHLFVGVEIYGSLSPVVII